MNKKKALDEGLSFTGLYSSNEEEFTNSLISEKKSHPKARIVKVWEPASKLSRSYCAGGGGWSAYADKKYFAYNHKEGSLQIINNHESIVAFLKKEYEDKLAKVEAELKIAQETLKNAQEILDN